MTHQDQWTEDLAHSGASASIPGQPEAASGARTVEVWKGNKRQREALRQKFGGKCAYCGCELGDMHADHLEPIIRVQTDPWGRRLPAAECWSVKPERNVVTNMMPACKGCNLHKGGYSLEGWRDILQRAPEIVGKQTSTFRAALRLGVISVSAHPVTFYFERLEQAALADREQPGTSVASEQSPRSESLSGEAGWIEWAGGDTDAAPVSGAIEWRNKHGDSERYHDATKVDGWRKGHRHQIVAYRVIPDAPSSQGGEGGE